jgi:hypothetical protein
MKTTRRQDLIATAFMCAALITMLLPVSHVWAQPADPVVGTWELNLAKSRFEPGPAPKSQTRTYEVPAEVGKIKVRGIDAEGRSTVVEYPVLHDVGIIKMSARGVDAEGTSTLMEYTASYDGRDYPLNGNPNADAISLKRIDDFTVEATTKAAGKVATRGSRVVSKDGKVMTITSKGTNAKGETVNNTLVFDKRSNHN